MNRADVVQLLLVLLAGCALVFAFESVASSTGGYLLAPFALLSPRASQLPADGGTTIRADGYATHLHTTRAQPDRDGGRASGGDRRDVRASGDRDCDATARSVVVGDRA